MSSRAQLFVGRLPIDIRERDVEQVFEKYGRLLRCDVKYGMYGATGRRGAGRTGMAYAFVDYDDRRDAEDAIKYENGREIRGQSIVVEWARGPSYRSGRESYGRSSRQRESYGRSSRQSSEECYRCRRTGHWARDCPELERDRYYPRTRQRSRSRSRSRSYRKRRSPSHSRSRSGDRRRSGSGYRQKSRSISRDKRVKPRSPSASVSPARSPSRSRSRSHGKSRRKAEKSKKSKRAPSKSPTRSRSVSKSVSRSPPMKRKGKSLSGSPENNYVDKNNSIGHYEKNRSISPSPRKESFRNDNYRSISRSKSR